MTESDRQKFAVAIGAMFETFGVEATEDLMRGYWIGLCDLSIESVEIAILRAIRECERLARPFDLRKLSGEQTGEVKAILAWDEVQKALPLGPYKHVDFCDRVVNAVIRNMGGWPSFVERFTSAEEEKWVRQEFIRCYRALSQSSLNDDACQPLIGLAQLHGANGTVSDAVPVAIGSRVDQPRLGSDGRMTTAIDDPVDPNELNLANNKTASKSNRPGVHSARSERTMRGG